MRYLGAHLTSSGGAKNTIRIAQNCGANSIQIMPTPPMRWSTKEIPTENAKLFVEATVGTNVKKLLMHGVYLINLARADSAMFHMSKLSVSTYASYVGEMMEYAKIINPEFEVLGVTFHPGSAKDLTPEEGVLRVSEGLNWVIENSKGEGMILLESSAGSGNVMGDTLEELAKMRDGVEKKERIGYVLDTQHMFVSGYDWINDLDGVVEKIEKVLGLENVKCFHLNDSMTDFGSHKDRHNNLGEGKIGEEAIKGIINHPKLKKIPFILETPNLKTEELINLEVAKLLSWATE